MEAACALLQAMPIENLAALAFISTANKVLSLCRPIYPSRATFNHFTVNIRALDVNLAYRVPIVVNAWTSTLACLPNAKSERACLALWP